MKNWKDIKANMTSAMADYVTATRKGNTSEEAGTWYGEGVTTSPAVCFFSSYDANFVAEVSECCDYYCGDMFSAMQMGLPIKPESFISKTGYGRIVISYDENGIHIQMGFEQHMATE